MDATYFVGVDTTPFDEQGDDVALSRRLTLEAGVTAASISAFYSEGHVKNRIRFCFAKRNETLVEAFTRLGR